MGLGFQMVNISVDTDRPKIIGGLRDFCVLKTTQSAFTDFIQDEYRTLPDTNDRIFSTVVTATWEYSTGNGVDFDGVWYVALTHGASCKE
jgi:urate oxidase